jgi:hypothetical protein
VKIVETPLEYEAVGGKERIYNVDSGVDNERIRSEFGFATMSVIDALPSLIGSHE